MITMKTEICVDVAIETAWENMARIDEVDLWVGMIDESYCASDQNRGLNAVRICRLTNGMIITEQFTHWEEGRAFTYETVGNCMPAVRWARNEWTLEAVGTKTMIRSRASLVCKWGLLGRLLEPLVLWGFKRDMPDIAASLKYFVEHGRAFEGEVKTLPRAPSVC